jgi:cytochrome oxidase Cu insertion factor (SCO1/SenC/PrrC family)
MFYTQCRSLCPSTLGKLIEIQKAFDQRGQSIEIVLVSYDSNHDQPRKLARFRQQQHLPAAWHLLSGSPEATARLAGRIGLGRYLDLGDHIFHEYRIVLLNADGVVEKALDWRHDKVAALFEPDPDR